MHQSLDVAGVPIRIASPNELRIRLTDSMAGNQPMLFVGVYSALYWRMRQDESYKALVKASETYVDGKGVEWAIRLLYPGLKVNRTATTDYWREILSCADDVDRDIFLIGSAPDRITSAAAAIRGMGFTLAGVVDGFGSHLRKGSAFRESLADADRPLVMIGLGAGKQEQLAQELLLESRNRSPCIFTVGGLFDHIAGVTVRAPKLVRAIGLEWAWRVVQEPRRLLVRYAMGNIYFVSLVVRQYAAKRMGIR